MPENEKKLGMFALIGLILGSSIGGGIFNATANVARESAAGPALLAWLIVGLGMLFMVQCLNNIVLKRPDLDGIVVYAEAGFGKFWGLISGWGYWLSCWLGNIAFAALLLSAIGNFIPAFHLGNNPSGPLGIDPSSLMPFIFISFVMWGLIILVNKGVENAAFINAVVLIAKLIPLFVVLAAGIVVFKAGVFTAAFWGNVADNTGTASLNGTLGSSVSLYEQIKGCFMVMLWVFVGVEGASVFSERARVKSEAARATLLGFIFLLVFYMLISLVPFGYFSQAELAGFGEPALAFVLGEIVGPWGSALVNLGLIISVSGAWLSWTLLPVQALQLMAKRKYISDKFALVNQAGSPTFALLITGICTQFFMFTFLFPNFTVKDMTPYDFAFTLCSSTILITWLLGGMYNIKLTLAGEDKKSYVQNILFGVLSSLFLIWMIIEAGLVYIAVSSITYVPAFVLYYKARKADNEQKPFAGLNTLWVALICLIAVVSIIMLAAGKLEL